MNHTYLYILLRKLNFLIHVVDFGPTFPLLLGKLTPVTTIFRIQRPTRVALCNESGCLYNMYNPLNYVALKMARSEPKHVGEIIM